MSSRRSVGIFDSGAGGISFLNTAVRMLPGENYIYYADISNAPYGERSEEEIKRLTTACCDYLYAKGVKAIVMACNTATSTAVTDMREKLNMPVVSMEPAVKPALTALEGGRALMLATPATVAQPRYLRLLERLGVTDEVVSVGCAGLAALVDARADGERIARCLDDALSPWHGETFDAIVLGCTHYIFVKDYIRQYAKAHFTGKQLFFDGNEGTARQLARVLDERGLINDGPGGRVEFYCSGDNVQLEQIRSFFG